MRALQGLGAITALALAGAATADVVVLADSVAEFSSVQGQDGWRYGFYNGDSATPWNTDDFEEMGSFLSGLPVLGGPMDTWAVDYNAGGVWTYLTATSTHPNSPITSAGRLPVEHWSVRRWISDFEGTVTLAGEIRDMSAGGGDGVRGRIFVDGVEVWSDVIVDGDITGAMYEVFADVEIGSIVDFALDPRNSDLYDTTHYTHTISANIVPTPATLALAGLGGIAMIRRRR